MQVCISRKADDNSIIDYMVTNRAIHINATGKNPKFSMHWQRPQFRVMGTKRILP